jgi:tetratricopeptide (TPR) repeat protein
MLTGCIFILLLVVNGQTQDVQTIISLGDSAYKQFDNTSALAYYSKALEMDSLNYEASWKLSRAYVDVGEGLADQEERKEYYRKADSYARKAVEIDSNGAKGHLYLSVAIGRVALDSGKKEQVRLSKEIKAEVDKALALDPNDDVAWHVLGRWHRKMATLSWIQRTFANTFLGGVPKEASVEKSAECFQKAIEIRPEHINHHLELGITYEELDQKDKAAEQYNLVLELPKKDADDEKYKKEAQELLDDL